MHDDGRQPVEIGNMSDSGDLITIFTGGQLQMSMGLLSFMSQKICSL